MLSDKNINSNANVGSMNSYIDSYKYNIYNGISCMENRIWVRTHTLKMVTWYSVLYLGLFQTSMIELFAKIINDLCPLTILAKELHHVLFTGF